MKYSRHVVESKFTMSCPVVPEYSNLNDLKQQVMLYI